MQEKKKPQLTTKAIVYVPICDGNHIAAAILDMVYKYTEIFERVKDLEAYEVYVESAYGYLYDAEAFKNYLNYHVDVDGNLYLNLFDIRAAIFHQFADSYEITDKEIFDAFELLINKNYVLFISYDLKDIRSKDTFFELHRLYEPCIDAALIQYYTGLQIEIPPPPLFDKARERRVVREQCSRATRIAHAGTLTVDEWFETLTHFRGRCAFNPEHRYEVLEHFIPIIQGGGTTVFNCIPACSRCNAIKRDRLPFDVTDANFHQSLPAIQAYLDKCYEQWLQKSK